MEMVPEDFNLWVTTEGSPPQNTFLGQIIIDAILFLCIAVLVVHTISFAISYFSPRPTKEKCYKLNPLTPDETRRLHYGITIQKVILKKMQLVELKIGLLKAILSSLNKKRKVKISHHKIVPCYCTYCNNQSSCSCESEVSMAR